MYTFLIFELTWYLTLQSAARLFGSSISSENLISVSGVGCGTTFLRLFLSYFQRKHCNNRLKLFITLFCMFYCMYDDGLRIK